MSAAIRIVVVAMLACIEIAGAAAGIASYGRPIGSYGFVADKSTMRVVSVEPGSAAALAGLAAGDEIAYRTLSLRGRKFVILDENVPVGAIISFEVVRGGAERAVTLRARELMDVLRAVRLTYAIAGLALGLVGLALVLMRPSRMTWGFAFAAPPLLIPIDAIFWAQQDRTAAGALWDGLIALSLAAQVTGVLVFASRFPDDDPRGIDRLIDRVAVPIGIVLAAIYLVVAAYVRFAGLPPAGWIEAADYALILPAVAALTALVSTYVTTPGGARTRLAPVIAAFVFLILAGVSRQLARELTADAGVLLALSAAFAASLVLLAAAVAYGVIRHRVMDVSFIISRTLVYSLLTIAAASLFTLIEYVFGKLLDSRGIAALIEIAAAIALGLSLNVAHRRLDDFVDRVLFRRRHQAERRLAGAAQALPYATTADAVNAALVEEPAQALDLASAALFRRDGSSYRRVDSHGWNANEAAALEADDRLVLRLRAGLEPIDPAEIEWRRPDLPDGERAVLYAVPVVAERSLEALALYGGHVGNETLDPDERRCLRELAVAAAIGYEHIVASELRRRLDGLEAENSSLRALEKKLSDLLGRRLA